MRELEELRRRYRPHPIKILFVGESPPARGTFFYKGDSGLARYTKLSFQQVYSLPDLAMADFLHGFKAAGCYLDDLCLEPVNRMKASDRRATWKEKWSLWLAGLRLIRPGSSSRYSGVSRAASGRQQKALGFWTECEARFHIQAWAIIGVMSQSCRACSLSFARLPFFRSHFCDRATIYT